MTKMVVEVVDETLEDLDNWQRARAKMLARQLERGEITHMELPKWFRLHLSKSRKRQVSKAQQLRLPIG